MSNSISNRVVVLESHGVSGREIWLRFVPLTFRFDDENPVLRIEVQEAIEPELFNERIGHIADDIVDDIEVADTTLSVWREQSDSPVEFQGKLTWKCEDYGINDYICALKANDAEFETLHSEIASLKKSIGTTLRFIDRIIDHIEKKQELTGVDDARFLDQIRLLRGVRRQFRDDEQPSL